MFCMSHDNQILFNRDTGYRLKNFLMSVKYTSNCFYFLMAYRFFLFWLDEFTLWNYFSTVNPDNFPPEVVTYDQWAELKPEKKSISGWIKGALRSDKKEMQESIPQNLGFILSTAPMWDRYVEVLYLF